MQTTQRNDAMDRARTTRARLCITTTAAVAALALVSSLAPAALASSWRSDRAAQGQLVEVKVIVNGRQAPLFQRDGAIDRAYFQAFRGGEYALQLHNVTGERIGVLLSVDGLNAVNGERTALEGGEPMYVLDPWETTTIRGWRSSLDEVRKFVFVDEERSYAERTGQANGDMGWVRVLAFRENRPERQVRYKINDEMLPYRRDEAGAPAPELGQRKGALGGAEKDSREMAQMAPRAQESSPGTGWGDRRYDPVRQVWFQPERVASDHLVFRYEYASGLRALGIYPIRGRDRLWERERGELGFAQPPRW